MVRALMEKILGKSPYQSPTDMGVNMVGFAITDDDACRDASKWRFVRRYFTAVENVRRTGVGDEQVDRLKIIMKKAGIDKNYSPARSAALTREQLTGGPVGAMVMPDGSVVTGKTSTRLGAASSLIMNALKHVSGVDLELEVISDEAIEPSASSRRISWAAKTRASTPTRRLWRCRSPRPRVRRPLASFRAWSSCAVAMPSLA